MTTIATDGKTIACESIQIGSHVSYVVDSKIFETQDFIIAGAGVFSQISVFRGWHRNKAHPDLFPKFNDSDFEVIVIDRNNNEYAKKYTNEPFYAKMRFPITMGSGCEYAMGAMLAGATPTEAVEIACRLDQNSGGEVETVTI